MRVHVKICGFTREQDVRDAAALAVDLFGFNLALGPRRISVARAAHLRRQVPLFARSVALFVDAQANRVLSDAAACGCDVVQLHGAERPDDVAFLARRMPVIKALRVRSAEDVQAVQDYVDAGVQAVLLDAWTPHAVGGSGASWDYGLLTQRRWSCPLILAGGLRPETVRAAIDTVRPQAVDVASGVESAPGIKDCALMRRLCAAVETHSGENPCPMW
ncbi:MAG: phosphoribosylanthranilate isomerase [Planctomycetota bacterium]|nr:MAG: phosphoribosylanthranilate isomerase [Planctomycetota bacterium]